MRVKCSSISDFMVNLRAAKVYNKNIYFEQSKIPLNQDQRNATSFELVYSLFAVVEYNDGGQALVECHESCGIDRYTADACSDGSVRMTELFKETRRFCTELGVKLLPGVLDT